jgi:hypothetical protein
MGISMKNNTPEHPSFADAKTGSKVCPLIGFAILFFCSISVLAYLFIGFADDTWNHIVFICNQQLKAALINLS